MGGVEPSAVAGLAAVIGSLVLAWRARRHQPTRRQVLHALGAAADRARGAVAPGQGLPDRVVAPIPRVRLLDDARSAALPVALGSRARRPS
jgi:hypothetical protein